MKEGLKNIRISDVTITATNLMNVNGTVEKPVEGLRISHVTGTCRRGSTLTNAHGVVLEDIQIAGLAGSPYFTNNVIGTGLEGAVPLPKK